MLSVGPLAQCSQNRYELQSEECFGGRREEVYFKLQCASLKGQFTQITKKYYIFLLTFLWNLTTQMCQVLIGYILRPIQWHFWSSKHKKLRSSVYRTIFRLIIWFWKVLQAQGIIKRDWVTSVLPEYWLKCVCIQKHQSGAENLIQWPI